MLNPPHPLNFCASYLFEARGWRRALCGVAEVCAHAHAVDALVKVCPQQPVITRRLVGDRHCLDALACSCKGVAPSTTREKQKTKTQGDHYQRAVREVRAGVNAGEKTSLGMANENEKKNYKQ